MRPGLRTWAVPVAEGVLTVWAAVSLCFLLMLGTQTDRTYRAVGKHATAEEVAEFRELAGYDAPVSSQYGRFLGRLLTLDFGYSEASGRPVSTVLVRAVSVSVAAVFPGFLLGIVLGLGGALVATIFRGRWPATVIMASASVSMATSFAVLLVAVQSLAGAGPLDLPVQGWRPDSIGSYFYYATLPTLVMVFSGFGYVCRFAYGLMGEHVDADFAVNSRTWGASESYVVLREILPVVTPALIARLLFSMPAVLVGGSFLLESYFRIPGVGLVTFQALMAGDQAVLSAVFGLSGLLFAVTTVIAGRLYRVFDPRMERAI